MTAFFHTLLNMSLTAAFVAVVVFLLRLALKGRAARQMICLLWLIVFARLLVPVTLQSPVSLVPDMEMGDPAPVVSAAPEAVPTQPVNTSPVQGGMTAAPPVMTNPIQNPVVTIPPNVSAPDPVVSSPVVETPPVDEEDPFPWASVLTVVWAAGVAAMLVYGVGSYLSIRSKLRFAIRTKDGWWEDPHLRSPFILGLVRPRIYLPCHMTPYARQFILCHERAHIRRGDHIIKPICWLALAIHWFNPLAWVAFLLLSRDIEVACDESVLRELGHEVKADYSATLLALATNGRFPAPTPLAFGEGDAKTRIKGVLNFKKPALWVTVVAVAVAIVAAVCLLTDPVDKFDPDGYTTLDCYPGLYFEQTVVEETGETTVMAYALENGKPVPVAGWSDQPADNLATLIHPDGEREVLLAARWEMSYRYEQYLVDYMMEQDEGWARRYLEEADDLITIYSVTPADLPSGGQIGDLGRFYGGIAYTPEENLLFCREGTAQVLPRWTPYSGNPHTVKVYPYDRAEDGTDRLDILWTGRNFDLSAATSYTEDDDIIIYTDDALITYLWDGEQWTAHNSADTIAFTDKPVSFDAANQRITVTYDPNAYTNGNPDIAQIEPGIIRRQFSIPAELGRVQTISVSELAYISRREDGDYDLTYGVYAMPASGTSDQDAVRILDLTAILKWNGLTEEFEITFTGAVEAGKTVIGEGTQTYPVLPEGSELLAELPEHELYLYTQPDSWRPVLQYREHSVELDTAIEIGRNPVQFFPGDRNGDGITEIVMLYHKGWGTGYDAFGLAACWADDDGLHVEFHDSTAIREEFNSNNTFSYDETRNVISVTYGDQSLSLRLPNSFGQLDWGSFQPALVTSGDIARYTAISENRWQLALDPGLSDGMPVLQYLPMSVNYTIEFTGTEFRTVEPPTLTAQDDGMLVQPYTVTPLENSPENPYYTDFELTHNGKTVRFSGRHLTEGARESHDDMLTYYFDMTGDGVPEPIIFLIPYYGTGPIKYQVHIFDGVTLEEYDASEMWSLAIDQFALSADENNFTIASDGLNISFTREEVLKRYENYDGIELSDSVYLRGDYCSVSGRSGTLQVSIPCLVDDFYKLSYGNLHVDFAVENGILTPSGLYYTDPDGVEVSQFTTLASLPEKDVYLYMDQDGSFTMQACGHYGPVPILNEVGEQLEPSTAAGLNVLTAVNLSGPDFEFISFTMKSRGAAIPIYYPLIWDGEQNVWKLFDGSSPLSTLPRDIVTNLTYPTDPEWYYKVAETGQYELFARHHGQEILLTWGNLYQSYDHDAHTGRMNLPVMKELEEGIVAVISEVNSGTGVGVDELVVYDLPIGFADYLYDWRDLAADFNRSNTLTYDRETNALTLDWNGAICHSGKLAGDLSVALDLEDGFTGTLIATGEIIRFTANEDGTFTARMETSIGRGNRGGFYKEETEWFWIADDQDSHYFPLSIGSTGFDLVWTVRFTGDGFEVVGAPTVESTAGEVALQAYTSFLNGSRSAVNAHSGESFVFSEFSRQVTPDETFHFEPTQYALVDLDGDGGQEMLLDVTNIGSMVLRFDGERICAFFFAGRQFSDVKTDGTFSASGGYADVSICRISFSGKDYEVDEFTCCRSDGETVSFFVDHQPVNEAGWLSAFDVWQQQEGVRWFSLTEPIL